MPNDTIPEWAMAEAASLRSAVIWQSNASNEIIAIALVEAERRGRDKAVSVLQTEAENPSSHDPAICLDMVIRKLMEGGSDAA